MVQSETKRDPQLKDDRPEVEKIYSLTASRDIEIVKRVFLARYDTTVSDTFAQDFIDFVEALTDGQQ